MRQAVVVAWLFVLVLWGTGCACKNYRVTLESWEDQRVASEMAIHVFLAKSGEKEGVEAELAKGMDHWFGNSKTQEDFLEERRLEPVSYTSADDREYRIVLTRPPFFEAGFLYAVVKPPLGTKSKDPKDFYDSHEVGTDHCNWTVKVRRDGNPVIEPGKKGLFR